MAAIEVQKFRVATLPVEAERVLGAEYWTRNGTTGELVIHTVGKDDKAVVTRTISRADVATMITEAKSAVGVTIAPLENGLVPTEYLPTYVDDVIEVSAYDELPGNVNANADHGPAEKGKIYLVVENTGTEAVPVYTTKVYRWGGTVYVQIIDGMSMADQAVSLANSRTISAGGVGSDGTWSVSFNGTSDVTSAFTLADTAVTAGNYGFIQVDSKGRLIYARALEMSDIPELDHTVVKSAASLAVTDPAW